MSSQSGPKKFGDLDPSRWPGERLGLPEHGQFSVGRIGRRVLAIMIDWAIALLLTLAFARGADPALESWITLLIFFGMQIIFIPTIGGSIGHRIVGLRIVQLGGGWVGVWRPIVRTALILLVIPVLVWDSDHRGFHDKIAGTALVRS